MPHSSASNRTCTYFRDVWCVLHTNQMISYIPRVASCNASTRQHLPAACMKSVARSSTNYCWWYILPSVCLYVAMVPKSDQACPSSRCPRGVTALGELAQPCLTVALVLSDKRSQARRRGQRPLVLSHAQPLAGCTLQEFDKHDAKALQQAVKAVDHRVLRHVWLCLKVCALFSKPAHCIQNAASLLMIM